MNSKLTLTIDNTVVKKAKHYARSRGRSLSDIVENYLRMITRENIDPSFEITPIVNSLRGSFKAPEDLDYKQALSKRLSDKYLESEEDSD